jgi:hypothetical protein
MAYIGNKLAWLKKNDKKGLLDGYKLEAETSDLLAQTCDPNIMRRNGGRKSTQLRTSIPAGSRCRDLVPETLFSYD